MFEEFLLYILYIAFEGFIEYGLYRLGKKHPTVLSVGGVSAMAVLATALIGAITTTNAVREWYPTLQKPLLTPPSWIFGPVWTLLYTLMTISLWRVWRLLAGREGLRWVQVFFIQLVLNAWWSIAFFGLRQTGIALMVIVLMWSCVAYLIVKGKRIDKTATYFLVPYLAWITFAAYLNFGIWYLN